MRIRPGPEKINEYLRWEAAADHDLPGRYSTASGQVAVFRVRSDDRPVSILHAHPGHGSITGGPGLPDVDAADRELIRAILDTYDGSVTFAGGAEALAGIIDCDRLEALFPALLGKWIYLPDVMRSLEEDIRHAEIVRFPMQSPYAVRREYWENSIDVRAAVPGLLHSLHSRESFRVALSELHVLATMGRDLATFYGGSGSVQTLPGHYRDKPVRTGLSGTKERFINKYLQSLGFSGLDHEDRFVHSADGVLLGRIEDRGTTFRHPPSESGCLDGILEALRGSLLRVAGLVDSGSPEDLDRALADAHRLFLCAHPFYNINNSVIMNIVNHCLLRARQRIMPHMLLDYIALRVGGDAYTTVFSRAVRDFSLSTAADHDSSEALERIRAHHERLQQETGRGR